MKVKIFTEGGKDIGLGHVSRCSSLYDEAINRGISAEFIVYGDTAEVDFLKGRNIINENWISKDYLRNSISSEDYVIVDSYKAETEIYEIISKLSKKAVFIDDTGRIDYPKGIIVNPSLDASDIDYSKSMNSIVLSGPDYVILRTPFLGVNRGNNSYDLERVLITMGGTDIRQLTPNIIDNILKYNLNFKLDVIVSADDFEAIKDRYDNFNNISIYSNIDAIQMMNLIKISDLAITAAGQTIYEIIAMKTPFLAIQVVDNQINNIRAINDYISPDIFLKYDDENFYEKFEQKFNIAQNLEFREIIAKKLESIIDGKGAARIMDKLVNISDEDNKIFLRKVEKRDVKDVFELSNLDYVRCYSINKEKIKWENHIVWFDKVTNDVNTVFYIVTDENGLFWGQIRYEVNDTNAVVSISLSEKLKGKGFSKGILNRSIIQLWEEKKLVKEIIAFVSEDNIASMKIFQGLNFKKIDVRDGMIKFMLRREDCHEN